MADAIVGNVDSGAGNNRYLYIGGAVLLAGIGSFFIYSWVKTNSSVSKKKEDKK